MIRKSALMERGRTDFTRDPLWPVCSRHAENTATVMQLSPLQQRAVFGFETAGVVDAIGGELSGSLVDRNHSCREEQYDPRYIWLAGASSPGRSS
jgi:hypothetical protein